MASFWWHWASQTIPGSPTSGRVEKVAKKVGCQVFVRPPLGFLLGANCKSILKRSTKKFGRKVLLKRSLAFGDTGPYKANSMRGRVGAVAKKVSCVMFAGPCLDYPGLDLSTISKKLDEPQNVWKALHTRFPR
jgi:hypothetical protein